MRQPSPHANSCAQILHASSLGKPQTIPWYRPLTSAFDRWGGWGIKGLSNLLTVTKLPSGKYSFLEPTSSEHKAYLPLHPTLVASCELGVLCMVGIAWELPSFLLHQNGTVCTKAPDLVIHLLSLNGVLYQQLATCGLQTSSISTTWEHVRNSHPWAPS